MLKSKHTPKTEFILSLSLEERQESLDEIMERFSEILEKTKTKEEHWLVPLKWNSLYEKASFKDNQLHIVFLANQQQQNTMQACISEIADKKKVPLNIL